jgi:UDP-2,3-diacylglucosamine hydrolase
LAIPIRKNKLISGDEDITFLGEDGMADSVFEEKTETKHYNYLVLDTVIYL